jgi:hypothetical protein
MKDSTFAERKERGCAHTNLLGSFEHPLGQDRHQKTLAVAGSRDLAFCRDLSIIMPDVVSESLSIGMACKVLVMSLHLYYQNNAAESG